MARDATRFSRVSIGFVDSVRSLVDVDPGDTGAVFSVTGTNVFVGNQTITGTETISSTLSVGGATTQGGAFAALSTASVNGAATFQSTVTARGTATLATLLVQSAATFASTLSADGAATFQSTVTARGQVNADAGIQVGGGTVAQIISSATTQLSFGAVPPLDSSSVLTIALSGASRGDALFMTPDSIWQVTAANRDISYYCSSSSTVGEVHAWAINSTLTSVTPTAGSIFRLTRIKFGNFPAA